MNIKGNVSSQAPTPTACSLQRPRATCSSYGSSPNSTSAGRTPRAPLLPVTQRWVLVPLLSKSDVTVLVYRGYLRIFFRKSNRKVTFKTEVPRRQRVSSSWLIQSHIFLLPYRHVTNFSFSWERVSSLVITAPGEMRRVMLTTPQNQSTQYLCKDTQATTR